MLLLCGNPAISELYHVKKHTMVPKRIRLRRIDSTNSYLARLLKEESPDGMVAVCADYQEVGRGRGGNAWESRPGKNLLASLLVFPAFLSASDQFALSRTASLAICDLLSGYGLSPKIKWPNDILAGQGKIAGILIENGITGSSISHSIIGMGINLNQEKFGSFDIPATSLVIEGQPGAGISDAFGILLKLFTARYDQLSAGHHLFEEEYLQHLYGYNQPGVFERHGRRFGGIVRGTDGMGGLLVETGGRVENCPYGEVRQLISPGPRVQGNQSPPSGQ